jgi:hypothetical protein
MLEFKQTMDQHSLTVVQDGKDVASLQWHPGRTACMVVHMNIGSFRVPTFTLAEMKLMCEKLEDCLWHQEQFGHKE